MKILTSKVVDTNNEPLIGAQIFVVDPNVLDQIKPLQVNGQSYGTVTDMNGRFTLVMPDIDVDDIAISFMGYKTILTDEQSIRTTPVFVLEEDYLETDEIVVVGTPKVKESFPDWLLLMIIPLVVAFAYYFYKYFNNNTTNSTAKFR